MDKVFAQERGVENDDIGDGGAKDFDNSKKNMVEAMKIMEINDNLGNWSTYKNDFLMAFGFR